MMEKELVWVSKEMKEALEKAESQEEQEKIFFKAIEDRKLDIKTQIENLEDDVLMFKAVGLRYKTELEKIYVGQSEQLEKLWKDFNAGDRIYKQAKQIEKDLQPVVNTIDLINKRLSDISTWKIENMIDLINKFNNMSDSTKEMLKILIESEKK